MCGCFIFESAKNTQLIDSKNKQVLLSTRDESSIHPEYSGALVLNNACELAKSVIVQSVQCVQSLLYPI